MAVGGYLYAVSVFQTVERPWLVTEIQELCGFVIGFFGTGLFALDLIIV